MYLPDKEETEETDASSIIQTLSEIPLLAPTSILVLSSALALCGQHPLYILYIYNKLSHKHILDPCRMVCCQQVAACASAALSKQCTCLLSSMYLQPTVIRLRD